MALKKSRVYKTISLPNAYHRIRIDRVTKTTIDYSVLIYPDSAAAADSANELPSMTRAVADAPYVLEGANPIEQAYVHVRTVPHLDLEDAIDC